MSIVCQLTPSYTVEALVVSCQVRTELGGSGGPRGAIAPPQAVLASPRAALASPRGSLASPWAVLASPQGVLASPWAALAAPQGALASPWAVLASPRAVLASEPRRRCRVSYISEFTVSRLALYEDANETRGQDICVHVSVFVSTMECFL